MILIDHGCGQFRDRDGLHYPRLSLVLFIVVPLYFAVPSLSMTQPLHTTSPRCAIQSVQKPLLVVARAQNPHQNCWRLMIPMHWDNVPATLFLDLAVAVSVHFSSRPYPLIK